MGQTPIQLNILKQVHEQKPEWMIPGLHITVAEGDFSKIDNIGDEDAQRLMQDTDALVEAIKDDDAVSFVIMARPSSKAIVRYMRGADLYRVTRYTETGEDERPWNVETFDGIFADQLGELLFGSAAQPMQSPMFTVVMIDPETGAVESVDI